MGRPVRNLMGQKFGKLLVIESTDKRRFREAVWLCKCECGNEKEVASGDLLRLSTTSCGCLLVQINKSRTRHGHCVNRDTSPEFGSWRAMKDRCYKPETSGYEHYGGRGITVCDRWLHSFDNFLEDMGLRPSIKHTLDRYPNNETGNYEPSNCRWATPKQQAGNKRNNKWLEHGGLRMIVSDWAEYLKVPDVLLRHYLRAKTIAESIEILKNYKGRKKMRIGKYKDGELLKEYHSAKEISSDGYNSGNIYQCIKGNMPLYRGFVWKYLDEKAA